VKNIAKLSQALNNVWLGQCRVIAHEARYDRFAHNDVVRVEEVRDVVKTVKHDNIEVKQVVRVRGEGVKNVRVGKEVVEELGEAENTVRVGKVEVPVIGKGRSVKLRRVEGCERGDKGEHVVSGSVKVKKNVLGKKNKGGVVAESLEGQSQLPRPVVAVVSKAQQVNTVIEFFPVYKSREEDLNWAKSVMVATIFVGDSVLALQQRMDDAGFGHVKVTHVGGDKVFLHCTGEENILDVFNESIAIFSLLFSNIRKWSAKNFTYERGPWVRVYGVPVHKWNADFFTLCVSGIGKFMQLDEGTADKERFDFARVLVLTPQLEIIKKTTEFFIDGSKYSVNMLEEWGCNLGEDAFLTEVKLDQLPVEEPHFNVDDDDDDFDEVQGEWELDDLVIDLQKEWSQHGGKEIVSRVSADVLPTSTMPPKPLNQQPNTLADGRKDVAAAVSPGQQHAVVSQLLPSPKYQDLCPENSKHIERKDEGSASASRCLSVTFKTDATCVVPSEQQATIYSHMSEGSRHYWSVEFELALTKTYL